MVDKKMQEWLKRQEGYRKWREAGHGEKVIHNPNNLAGDRLEWRKKYGIEKNEKVQKTYDELSKPTESERLQDELEPIVHPAMAPKRTTPQTLEEEKEEWDFCMDQADHDTMLRREMARIRKEWKAKGWKEKGVTDTHKVVYEAERRIKEFGKKDINKYKKDSHEIIGGNDE